MPNYGLENRHFCPIAGYPLDSLLNQRGNDATAAPT